MSIENWIMKILKTNIQQLSDAACTCKEQAVHVLRVYSFYVGSMIFYWHSSAAFCDLKILWTNQAKMNVKSVWKILLWFLKICLKCLKASNCRKI